ncbi:MAG: copper-containing nitrite reductase [Bacteroidetes bacterium]|nr:copper-containing nitrite reductase [Bacteroidota bacterium]
MIRKKKGNESEGTSTASLPVPMNTVTAVNLPKPRLGRGTSVSEALQLRKTTREMSDRKLPLQMLSNLLWAAFGVNRMKGPFDIPGRTAASASNSQEIDLYVALEEGVYLYDAFKHRLDAVIEGDMRALAIGPGQASLAMNAPVQLIYVAVPGPMIRVRQGDLVEIHLSNDPSDMMSHSIDMHAVIGPGGGAAASVTLPGHTSVFSFRALHPGLFIYHCATQPVPMHIANGMYGMILVQPKKGLPHVEKEFYIMQSEFYTTGNYEDPGLQQFDLQKALAEDPTYVVFNGSVGAVMGDNALKVDKGQEVRLYVGNIGPNLISSFHVIGELFDNVYGEGGSTVTSHDIQTTLIPAGGAAIVEFKAEVPGTYTFVDHSIFRAFNKGAMGQIIVSGSPSPELFSGKQEDEIYLGGQSAAQEPSYGDMNGGHEPQETAAPGTARNSQQVSMTGDPGDTGEHIFGRTCIACHQANAKGIPRVFPPLSGSDFLRSNKYRAIDFVMHGHSGRLVVNGTTFNNTMPPQPLNDNQISNVLTYVRTHFGNSMSPVTVREVEMIRQHGVPATVSMTER